MAKWFGFLLGVFILGTALSNCLEAGTSDAIAATRLTSFLAETETSVINVASTSGFPAADVVVINSEIISYTSKTSTTFVGLTRGAYDTDPASHSLNNRVYTLAAGVINTSSGFSQVESLSDSGPIRMLWAFPSFFGTAVAGIIANDYSFTEGEVYGFPLYWIELPLLVLSAMLVVLFFVILASIARGLLSR